MTFPALVPSARTYVIGNVPQIEQVALSGASFRYRQGNRRVGQTLELAFNNISESELLQIKNHYILQDGSYNIFFLSQEVWSGYAVAPVPSPSNVAWRYATAPVITDGSCDLWSASVKLVSYLVESGDINVELPGMGANPNPIVDYIYDGGSAAATPARDYIIDSGASR